MSRKICICSYLLDLPLQNCLHLHRVRIEHCKYSHIYLDKKKMSDSNDSDNVTEDCLSTAASEGEEAERTTAAEAEEGNTTKPAAAVAVSEGGEEVKTEEADDDVEDEGRHREGKCDQSGQVKIFKLNDSGSNYTLFGEPLIGEAPSNYFGGPVAITGDAKCIAVGAVGNSKQGDFSGQLQTFHLPSP